ncbi:MAG TPA: endonuclease/exonuclease/phosphatase family protein [Ktedonosporobacter sp.]|jgi:endonuclease/exonuclease/phosphatase family metal-dependent hydrolase|nr:endonuclease/exonuclease/phosphatase family protein [Ktedonosporobacter sp.]
MTRIVSYNILTGGYNARASGTRARRINELTKILRAAQPDIAGIVEATHPGMQQKPLIIEEIAETLGMQLVLGGEATHYHDYRLAFLTRLPIIHTHIHPRPGILNKPLLEVCVEEAGGEHLTAFVTHLSAAFNRGRAGGHIRLREAQEIMRIMAPLRAQKQPHMVMGDFNSLAPGDPFQAHLLLRYLTWLDKRRQGHKLADGHPHLDVVVPPELRILNPLLRAIPRNRVLSTLFDAAAAIYAPRGSIKLLRNAGYVDCYRHLHPHTNGFTCPATLPAGRIDYIFVSPDLASRLVTCDVITEGEGIPGNHASDHLAVTATLGERTQSATD